MFKYRSIIENPEKLRSMTGLTADEFHALVPIFHTAFEAYMKRRTIDGRVRYCRRYVSYANSPLPTTEDKLLFILTYLERDQKLTPRIKPIQEHCNRTEIKKGFA